MIEFDVYLDSDGVICDFDLKSKQALGKTASEFEVKGQFWAALTEYDSTVEKFFLNLPKYEGADDLVNFCLNNFRSVKILTASGFTPTDVKQQKLDYYAREYPGIECIVVNKSPDKAAYASPTAILIDDRQKSITPWVEAGGIGILHYDVESTIETLKQMLTE